MITTFSQTQCLHPILPGTQQETLYFEVLGCPVVGLTCQKSTWKGVFGPFKVSLLLSCSIKLQVFIRRGKTTECDVFLRT